MWWARTSITHSISEINSYVAREMALAVSLRVSVRWRSLALGESEDRQARGQQWRQDVLEPGVERLDILK
jgi:hypothetical protein